MNRFSRPVLVGGALLVLATLIAYWPALHAGFLNWDDDIYVTHNPLLTAPDGWQRIWFSKHSQSQYFPLVFSTLRVEHRLWGLNPAGYHAINVLMHGLNAVLAWTLLRRLAVPGAWVAAAIFALHPVQVESVAWITELKNTQSALFYLLALGGWLKFLDRDAVRQWQWYALAVFLYVLALLSKTTACTFPAAMVLVLYMRREPINRSRALQIAPFVALGLAMGLVSVWWEGHLINFEEQLHVALGPVERLLIATRALWFYFGKLIWPANLSASYPRWDLDPGDPSQYIWTAACIAVAVFLWRKRRTLNRGVIAAIVFFGATLSPLLGFFSLYTFHYSFVADHYQYPADLGPIALFAGGLAWVFEKWRMRLPARFSVTLVLLGLLGFLTWRHAGIFHSAETLWRDTLRKNPASWLAHNNLGTTLSARGNRPEAEAHYREALRLNPDDGDTHYNLANLLFADGRREDALEHFQQAARFKPNDAEVHNNLGIALHALRRTEEAIVEFKEALRCRPEYAGAHFNLGVALETRQKRAEAIEHYREVLRLQPDSVPAKARLRALGVPGEK